MLRFNKINFNTEILQTLWLQLFYQTHIIIFLPDEGIDYVVSSSNICRDIFASNRVCKLNLH